MTRSNAEQIGPAAPSPGFRLVIARSAEPRVRPDSPDRNRASAAWLRVQLGELDTELYRAAAYETRQLTIDEIRRALTAIRSGRDWHLAIGGGR